MPLLLHLLMLLAMVLGRTFRFVGLLLVVRVLTDRVATLAAEETTAVLLLLLLEVQLGKCTGKVQFVAIANGLLARG